MSFVALFAIALYCYGMAVVGIAKGWSFLRLWLVTMLTLLLALLLGLGLSQAFSEESYAYHHLRESSVRIVIGSASIVDSPKGHRYLLTNWHVCNLASSFKKIRGHFPDGRLVTGTIVKSDPLLDLCAARVSDLYTGLKIARRLIPLETVYTRGYPHGILTETSGRYSGRLSWSYTFDIDEVGTCFAGSRAVRDPTGRVRGCEVVYHDNLIDMYVRPGSSGSPAVDVSGALVGVVSMGDDGKDQGGMVRLEDVQAFFKDL